MAATLYRGDGPCAHLRDESGQILLVRENYACHDWDLPGGRVEPGETPWQAAAREALEECGIVVGVFASHVEPGKGLNIVVACRILFGHPQPASAETEGTESFGQDNLPGPILPSRPPAVRAALSGRRGLLLDTT